MFFTNTNQLRLEIELPLSHIVALQGLPNRPDETEGEYEMRTALQAQIEKVFERNGGSFAGLKALLAKQELRLADAYTQVRKRRTAGGIARKPCRLIVFMFLHKGRVKADQRAEDCLKKLLSWRYEYVSVGKSIDLSDVSLFLTAKTQAAAAVYLKTIDDPQASAYGIVVQHALPKKERPVAAPEAAPDPKSLKASVPPIKKRRVRKQLGPSIVLHSTEGLGSLGLALAAAGVKANG